MILDTSVLIQAEREGRSLVDLLAALPGSGEAAVSAITLAELAEGVARARDRATRLSRQLFLDGVRYGLDVEPIGPDVAIAAGVLNGELRTAGITIGLADVIIAATAQQRGYGVATLNGRHFKRVAGLDVVEL